MSRALSVVVSFACALVFLGAARAIAVPAEDVHAAGRTTAQATPQESGRDLDSARRRWERLSPEEQQRLRARYERLRRMGETERRELERRRRHLERVERRLVERLDDAGRRRLAEMSPEDRERLLNEMVEDELRGQARRLEEKLPTDWRARLQDADPTDRRRFFEQFKEQLRREWRPRAFDSLGADLGVPREEVEAWKRLPAEEQRAKLLELGKRQRERAVARHGLPSGVDVEEWRALENLPPELFFEEAMRLREAHGWEPGRPFFGPPPPGADDGFRDEARRFRRAARRRPEDRLDYAHVSPEERRELVERRRRERFLAALNDSGLVSPEQVEEMRAANHHVFWKRAREWNDELGLGLGRGRRADGPPRGDAAPPEGPPPGPRHEPPPRRARDDVPSGPNGRDGARPGAGPRPRDGARPGGRERSGDGSGPPPRRGRDRG